MKLTPLDLTTLPLEGTHLIEASAGTGKTYTASHLVLRWILEKNLRLRDLAVVTFTKPAAAELAQRIRELISQTRLKTKETEAQRRLALAESELDLATITTIHGFCAKLLKEFAFELRTLPGFTIIESEDELIEAALADFWRREIATFPPESLKVVATLTPSSLSQQLYPLLRFPGLELKTLPNPQENLKKVETLFEQLRQAWQTDRARVGQFLQDEISKLKANIYKQEQFESYLQAVDQALEENVVNDAFMKLQKAKILTAQKKNFVVDFPDLKFWELWEQTPDELQAFAASRKEQLSAFLLERAFRFLQEKLEPEKNRRNVKSYQDLLGEVVQGVTSGSERVLRVLSDRFRVVMVDEFQDTDPAQVKIFEKLFQNRADKFLAYIGDPKQAIYRFRGGDLATYLQVRQQIPEINRWTMTENYRSEASLLEALNGLYAAKLKTGQPFLTEEIQFHPLKAKAKQLPITLQGERLPPVTLWPYPDTKTNPKLKKKKMQVIGDYLVAEIQRLLEAQTAESTRLRLRDMAILVRSHRSAQKIHQHLASWGLKAVLGKAKNLFASQEAEHLHLILALVLSPQDEGLLKALFVSPLMGWDDQQLQAWSQDEDSHGVWYETLRKVRQVWESSGAGTALERFLTQLGAFQRQPGDLRNERRFTNFRHLLELLQTKDLEMGRLPERTYAWYNEKRQAQKEASEAEDEERLESDEEAIQIITMHKAKGLEWPVVFAVELWGKRNTKGGVEPLLREQGQLFGDLRPDTYDLRKQQQEKEYYEEAQRLAYVALTRPKALLYVVTAGASLELENETKDSPANWLFSNPEILNLQDASGQPLFVWKEPSSPQPLPREEVSPGSLTTWPSTREIHTAWSVGSYTRLAGETSHRLPLTSNAEAEGLLAFPKGKNAGLLLHSLVEKLDFKGLDGNQLNDEEAKKVKLALESSGSEYEDHLEAVLASLSYTLQAPLLEDDPEFSLSKLSRQDRASEVEFYMTAAHPQSGKEPLTQASLQKILGKDKTWSADFQLEGYLHGFIDLVFTWKNRWYILDWKSNYLGPRPEDYLAPALETAMQENRYHLQYHIYTAAWWRHLTARGGYTWDNFGGVLYLFLRGLTPQVPRAGIYFTRPEEKIIRQLVELL